MTIDLEAILKAYELPNPDAATLKPLGAGHIHQTFLLTMEEQQFVLQQFNTHVFHYADRIANNQKLVLEQMEGDLLSFELPLPQPNLKGELFTAVNQQLFRLFPFVAGQCIDQVHSNEQAFISAKAFAGFIQACVHIDPQDMLEVISGFHDLKLRYQQFKAAVDSSGVILDLEQKTLIKFYLDQQDLVSQYLAFRKSLPLRVTHNDTKINNLIFSEDGSKVNAIIDLDTIMPGLVLYDFGDLVRTVCCSEDENSRNWNAIHFKVDRFEALLKGFMEAGTQFMEKKEILSLAFGGEMMTYIMGLRFLTDYLRGNVYYSTHYPDQNFHRAKNQAVFLQAQIENRTHISKMIQEQL